MRKYKETIMEWIYLITLFIVGRLPMRDFDIWFHLKSGELFWQQGHLQFTEVFSYAAFGRTWYPYEWLFQVTTYLLSQIGLWTLPLFIGLFIVLMQWVFLRILSGIYNVKLIPRLILSFIFFVSIYEFHTIRPHVIAYTCVAITLWAILDRIYTRKRWILFLPLVTLIWTNLHSSSFLSWGLPLSYGVIVGIWWLRAKKQEYVGIMQDLGLVTVVNAIVTILPPLGFSDYRLLWEFFADRVFIAHFIAEWGPISESDFGFWMYTGLLALAILTIIYTARKGKSWSQALVNLPLLIMAATTYSASRNAVLGTLGILLIIASNITPILSDWYTKKTAIFWKLFASIIVIYYVSVLFFKHQSIATDRLYFPVKSTQFAAHYLKGHMFNDYAYGGYIEYIMYPSTHVFFDGRADVFHTREMRDYFRLTLEKDKSDSEYQKVMNTIWDTYDISYVIAPTRKNNVWRKVTRILQSDPSWALVYWDDDSQIFVRRNGKNDDVIQKFEAKASTPYLRNPFEKNHVEQALFEYQRMNNIVKTARTDNAIGYIDMLQGKFDDAKQQFVAAINIDPTFESPYMNLAELAAADGDRETAIKLYQTALKHAPDRGLIYIRLGQLMLEHGDDKQKVQSLWQTGIKLTIDRDAVQKLKDLLKTLAL